MPEPFTLQREISPPPKSTRKSAATAPSSAPARTLHRESGRGDDEEPPGLAAVEAGEAQVRDHLAYFASHLAAKSRPEPEEPRVSIEEFEGLWKRNQWRGGRLFVVHQHNHPVAGVHYDLRLQFSQTSTVSFAIPYGLPGNPNSRRRGRMAIETRVHNLWNNLIESASAATGSLLIWDTGEYEALDRHLHRHAALEADSSSASDASEPDSGGDREPENERLIRAFRNRFVRLRLHGTRLPDGYTVTLRLPSANSIAAAKRTGRPTRKRRKRESKPALAGSGSEAEEDVGAVVAGASEGEGADAEDAQIRADNAYTGATNSIGSVHQRRWYLELDRVSSGFAKEEGSALWKRGGDDGAGGFESFFVRGADVERSVVTGRSSEEVLVDEGVEGFRARGMWRPVLE